MIADNVKKFAIAMKSLLDCLEIYRKMSYNMAMTPSDAVREFHEKFDIPKVHPSNDKGVNFRMSLIFEEAQEVFDAAGVEITVDTMLAELVLNRFKAAVEIDQVNLLKELADLIYVIYGTAESFGWNLDEAVRRVHESNMSKLDVDGKPIYREDGKVLKGPNYREPYLGDLV